MTRITADISVSLDSCGCGAGEVDKPAFDAGLVDALTLRLVPIMLGAGTPVFTAERRAQIGRAHV